MNINCSWARTQVTCCTVLSFRVIENIIPGPEIRTDFSGLWPLFLYYSCRNIADLGVALLSCLVYELQKASLPGLEPRTVFFGGVCGFSKICFWSQGISMPSLVGIGVFVLPL
jgi:hypothetical protein